MEEYQVRLVNLKKEGIGRALYEGAHQNEILVAQWSDGKKNGWGLIYDKDKKRIIRRVEFKDDEPIHDEVVPEQRIMHGIIDSSDGTRWEGEIIDGEACGVGCIYNSKNERTYKGFYIDGGREGYGKSYYEGTGNLAYEGLWCRDMRHGEGTSYDRQGNVIVKGLFLEDNILEINVVIRSFPDIDNLSTLTETLVVSDNALNELKSMDLSECRKLQTLKIGSNCCKNVRFFRISRLRELQTIEIGSFSFTSLEKPTIPDNSHDLVEQEHRTFEISFCPCVTSIKIDPFSFFEYNYFMLHCAFCLAFFDCSGPGAPGVPSLAPNRGRERTDGLQFLRQRGVLSERIQRR